MSDIPVCIDISHHQGTPDMREVAASGVLGLIHKATEGSSFIDSARAKNCSNAIAAGIAVSTYFWLKPGDGRSQTEFYLSVVDPAEGERVVIDYEEDGCSLTTLKDAVQALLDYGKNLQITVYSGHLLKQVLGDSHDAFLAEHTDLWLAQYTSNESSISWPDGTYPVWSLWQYSESGRVPGIDDAYVDLDNFNGSDENFLKWIRPAGTKPPEPGPVPEPSAAVVEVAIDAPEGVEVEVSINGSKAALHRRKRLLQHLRKVKRGPDIER
jgi:lysozyme